jgi:hypothetical protein
MEKLKLNLDDLKVESFDTTPDVRGQPKGTIYGHTDHAQVCSVNMTCFQQTCPDFYTCDGGQGCQSAGGTCYEACTYYNCPTVTANNCTCVDNCNTGYCNPTQYNTCPYTCGNSCGGTCGGDTCVTCGYTCECT